jgi:uncharacterized protein YjbI with pentapeptide repeats
MANPQYTTRFKERIGRACQNSARLAEFLREGPNNSSATNERKIEIWNRYNDIILNNGDGANLEWADLRGADLREANFYKTNLGLANLGGANLKGASLIGVGSLEGTILTGANIEELSIEEKNAQRIYLGTKGLRIYRDKREELE